MLTGEATGKKRRCAVVRRRSLFPVAMGCAVVLFVGCAGVRSEAPNEEEQDTPKLPRRSKHAHPKQRRPKKTDAQGRGPSTCSRVPLSPPYLTARYSPEIQKRSLSRTTCPAAPPAGCSLAPTKQTS